ncbi:MAG: hypothetical protein KDC52_14020 [Ignavibacteriae bacterium]|nr:hypothetical protein [Ignavibacteriota bacterium]
MGFFRLIFFIILGYIIIKTFKFIINMFTGISEAKKEQQVYETKNARSKIDKKDVIDAKFEEIDDKENTSQ